MEMPPTPSGSTKVELITGAIVTQDVDNGNTASGETGEKIGEVESKDEIGEIMASMTSKINTIASTAETGKPKPVIVDYQSITDPKLTKPLLDAIMPDLERNKCNSNSNISVDARLTSQETKLSEFITTINKFCNVVAKRMDILGESIKQANEQAKANDSVTKKLISDFGDFERGKSELAGITESLTTLLNQQSNQLPIEINKMSKSVGGQSVPTITSQSAGNNTPTQSAQQNQPPQTEPTNENQSDRNSEGNSNNSLAQSIQETLKLEIINKGMGIRRDYKLTNSMKFELFYDYFSSELENYDLLHVIDSKVRCDVTNDRALAKQKRRVRDILINHLDQSYHAKVMQCQDPLEILNKLKELKRCEVNLTSHSLRRQLCNMKYIIGKTKAGEFIDKFEELVRNFENSSGGGTLSDDEKRDMFYNAVMVSVPNVQTVEFLTNTAHQKSVPYEQLKNIIL